MILFDRPISAETYAVVRFGLGFPARGTPVTAADIMDRLSGPDHLAAAVPVIPFAETMAMGVDLRRAQRDRKKANAGGEEAYRAIRRKIGLAFSDMLLSELSRFVEADDPFRERLQRFWTNHFTARSRSIHLRTGPAGYGEEAIRPHMAGRFAELLKAAVTHPFMLVYLDQTASVGPNSRAGKSKGTGLNENLAREVLELHTLGVGGPYIQADVTQLAELLTGLNFSYRDGALFEPQQAEPGAETVLGRQYGGNGPADLSDIHTALEDLSVHPATAGFICAKLAAYFVADRPDPDIVAHMTAAYRRSDGHLSEVYRAMLEHPAAWRDFGAKVKWPLEYVGSSLRALGFRAADLRAIDPVEVRKLLQVSLRRMGQEYKAPPGPDGWPDTAEAWVIPHGLAARIDWAMELARRIPGGPPDPRAFVTEALGDAASSQLIWAAGAAESRTDGVGIVLASAEFNRR